MRIIDWVFDRRGAKRAAAIFLFSGGIAFVLFVLIGSAVMLPFGAGMDSVLSGAIGAALGTGLVNGAASFWWT